MKSKLITISGLGLSFFFLLSGLTVYTQEDFSGRIKETGMEADLRSETIKTDITVTNSIDMTYENRSFLSLINSKAYAAPVKEKDNKALLRRQWKEMLGMDVFMPYFKAKDVEDFVKEKARINFFKMKGEPKLQSNQVQYMFNVKF